MAYSNSPKFRWVLAVERPEYDRYIQHDPRSVAKVPRPLTTEVAAKKKRLANIHAAVLRLRLKGEGRL